jgi:predicted nucleotidyltransferase
MGKKKKTKAVKKADTLLDEAGPYLRVEYWFFAYPDREIGLSGLSDAAVIAKTTANRVIRRLEAENFVTIHIMGKIWSIKLNKDHQHILSRKIPFHLSQIYESGIVDHILRDLPNARAVILFGSYRKGDDTEESDIDIAVEVVENKPLEVRSIGTISQMGFRRNVKINLHIFSRNNIDLNIFANIANGIVLDGFLEVRP